MKRYLLTLALVVGVPAITQAASFDCAKAATSIEKLVCSSPATSDLDEQLGQAYKAALEKTTDKETLKQQQRTWLKEKQNACKDSTCLFDAYKNRLVELSNTATLANVKPKYKLVKGEQFQLCKDFLSLINRVEKKPYPNCGLDYEFDDAAKKQGFKEISWVEVNPKDYLPMLKNRLIYLVKNPSESEVKERAEKFELNYDKSKMRLWTADFDLNLDGKKDKVFKTKYRDCASDSGGDTFIVRDDGGLDNLEYARKISGEAFFYEGRTYITYGNAIQEGFGLESYISKRDVCYVK